MVVTKKESSGAGIKSTKNVDVTHQYEQLKKKYDLLLLELERLQYENTILKNKKNIIKRLRQSGVKVLRLSFFTIIYTLNYLLSPTKIFRKLKAVIRICRINGFKKLLEIIKIKIAYLLSPRTTHVVEKLIYYNFLIVRQILNPKKIFNYVREIWYGYQQYGLRGIKVVTKAKLNFLSRVEQQTEYVQKLKQQQKLYDQTKIKIKTDLLGLSYKPLISILMPTYNTDGNFLRQALDSVQRQVYENWELCIVDDASDLPQVKNILQEYSVIDKRIKIKYRDINGHISAASNDGLAMAKGEFIGLLDHDDVLHEFALAEIIKELNKNSNWDLLYTDEDKINERGEHSNPLFKPDWSPDLLRSQNYICHFAVIRKSIMEEVKGFRKGFEGAQDYDLFLRITEITKQIVHIPKILYSWRQSNTSTSANPNAKPYAQNAGLCAVREHVQRIYGKDNAKVTNDPQHLFVYDAQVITKNKPLISIIIPTKDGLHYLAAAIKSIVDITAYENYEIIILDNNSQEQQTKEWLRANENAYNNIQVVSANYEFNWSKLNNHGMTVAKGEIYVFLNNDTEIISADWLDRINGHFSRDNIGTIGAQLLYADNTIQHAGVVIGFGGFADHIYKGAELAHYSSPFISPLVKRNVLANTGACLAISKKTIAKIGLFNEQFIICGGDIEICLRAHEQGLYNIYDPYIKLYHFESKTRDPSKIPAIDYSLSKIAYGAYLEQGDPYYNRNLSLANIMPTIRN